VKPGQSRLVEAFVRKLSEAADVERDQNEEEKKKQHGGEVRYGQLVQLLHVKSNKYLTVNKRLPALLGNSFKKTYKLCVFWNFFDVT
jgi:hypothetical protein